MNRNDFRPAAVGITAGVLTVAALVAILEHDPFHAVAARLARDRLSPEEQAELTRIEQDRAATYRAHCAEQEIKDAERAAEAERDLAGFDPQLLSVPGTASAPTDLTVSQLADEIVHTEDGLRWYGTNQPTVGADVLHQHGKALRCEWRRRDSFDARTKLPLHEQMRHRIAAEKVNTALYGPWPRPSTALPVVEN